MKNHYIQAVLEMINAGSDVESVLVGLSKTLQAKGHTRLHASVLRGVLRVLHTESTSVTKVVTASEADVTKFADTIKEALASLGAGTDYKTEVDNSLIGGFVAEHNNTIIDTSYKAKLVSLYRDIAK